MPSVTLPLVLLVIALTAAKFALGYSVDSTLKTADSAQIASRCERDCRRDLDFQLSATLRTGVGLETLAELVEGADVETRQRGCWHYKDYHHCLHHCEDYDQNKTLDQRLTAVDTLCLAALSSDFAALRCMEQYHNSVEEHCMAFMNAAVKEQNGVDFDEKRRKAMCGFLHDHLECLIGNMHYYCGSLTTELFKRENIEQYFDTYLQVNRAKLRNNGKEHNSCYEAKLFRDPTEPHPTSATANYAFHSSPRISLLFSTFIVCCLFYL